MSIARLRQIAEQKLPLNVSGDDEVDELRVLMAAGLIAGLRLRVAAGPDGCDGLMVRVLAITPDGHRLLRRNGAVDETSSLATKREVLIAQSGRRQCKHAAHCERERPTEQGAEDSFDRAGDPPANASGRRASGAK